MKYDQKVLFLKNKTFNQKTSFDGCFYFSKWKNLINFSGKIIWYLREF